MFNRIKFFFSNIFKKDTSCYNLIKQAGYTLLIIIIIIIIYLGLVGIGKIIYLILGLVCQHNVKFVCDFIKKDGFFLFSLLGVLFILFSLSIIAIIAGFVCCLCYIFQEPCLEMSIIWHKSKHLEYNNDNIYNMDDDIEDLNIEQINNI